jgi:restriction endonuclease Mrr
MVGAPVVQQTLGAMWKVKADQSIIVTTSGFTVYAREQAKEAPIELWDKRTLQEFVMKYMI